MTKENSLKSNEYTLEDEYEFFVFALDVVREAGNLVKSAFAKPVGTVYTKASATDFVTETDRAVEELLIGRISSRFPDHKFIGEEGASSGKKYEFTDAPTWIIDPIDGTTNFVHRIPFLGICVGLTIKKRLCAGIVYNPITDELYYAQSGRGAFKNGFQIHTSSAKGLKEAVICQSQGIHNIREKGQEWLNLMLENQRKLILGGIHGNRSFGAASINMVFLAQGSIDAYVECGLHSWDMAAAVVIVREAGGTVIDPTGVPFDLMSRKVLCASTPELAKEFSSVLSHIDFAPEI